jgi:hypothetical protein
MRKRTSREGTVSLSALLLSLFLLTGSAYFCVARRAMKSKTSAKTNKRKRDGEEVAPFNSILQGTSLEPIVSHSNILLLTSEQSNVQHERCSDSQTICPALRLRRMGLHAWKIMFPRQIDR